MLPHNGKLYKYDRMAINMIVENVKGGLSYCDVAINDDLEQFNANYLHLTETVTRQHCQPIQWHLHQSLPGMGSLPQRLAEDDAAYLVPIPSLSNGRLTRCPISGKITESNKHNIK